MNIESSIKHLVVDPLRSRPEIQSQLQRKGDEFDDYVRLEVLKRGGAYQSNALLSHLFAYTHLLQHYDALWTVLQLRPDLTKSLSLRPDQTVGVIDLGCGPLTATLALADDFASTSRSLLKADVVGIDHAPGAIRLAHQFFNCGHLHPDSRFLGLASASPATASRVCRFLGQKDTVVILASYFFGQTSIADVRPIAQFVKSVALSLRPAQFMLVYLNASTTQAASRFIAFASELGLPREERRTDYEFRVYRRLQAMPESSRIVSEGEPLTYSVIPIRRFASDAV